MDTIAPGDADAPPLLIVPTPAGVPFTQFHAQAYAAEPWLVFACGRYEGIDHRVVDDARRRGFTRVALNAQEHAVAFYAKAGFTPFGETLVECDILHQPMELAL